MTIQFRNTDIHFSEQGDGDTLVLLHGFLEDSTAFAPVQESLSEHFRTILIDLPGHGKSGTIGYVHSMDDMADAVEAVLQHLEINQCVMVGHSMGGYVTLSFAERYAHRLCGMGLFHSSALADSPQKQRDRQRAIDLVMKNQNSYVELTLPNLFTEKARALCKTEISALIQQAKGFSPQGIVANLRGMMQRPDRTHVLGQTELPILIIHGLEDTVVSTEAIRQQAALNRSTTFLELGQVAHMGYLEAPDICTSAIRSFAERAFGHG